MADSQNCSVVDIPELIQVNTENISATSETLSGRINIDIFSSYLKLIFTTSRVLSFYKHKPVPSLYNALQTPTI